MTSRSRSAWACSGLAALAVVAGALARRSFAPAAAAPEELRDAVAAPFLAAGAPRPSWAFAVRPAAGRVEKPVMSARLNRLADALDARVARLRRSAP